MSNLVRQYTDVVGGLQRREPVEVRLPGGTIVKAIPEQIEVNGQPFMQLYVQVDGSSVGPIEAQIRMSPETYEKSLVKAQDATPRLVAMQERRTLMLNRRNGED